MSMFKKVAMGFAAISMVAAPVVASAASDLRAVSAVEDENEAMLGLPVILGLLAAVGLIVVVADDGPSSP